MKQNILVPTDFSENAQRAASYAAKLARKKGSRMILLHVNDLAVDSIREPYPGQAEYSKDIERELEKQYSDLQWRFKDVEITSEIIHGQVSDSILSVAKKENVELIVMGTQGASGLKEMFIGSQTAAVIKRTSVPVLSIPAEYEHQEPDGILFATNCFEKDPRLLRPVIEMAQLFRAKVHVVLFHEVSFGSNADDAQQLGAYVEYLSDSFPDVEFTGEILEGDDFGTALEIYHASHRTDIAALITYPKGFWERLLNKSMTRKVASSSTWPVLSIPG